MSLTDPIADMLTRIRNACLRKHEVVKIPFSKVKMGVIEVLYSEGFVGSCQKEEGDIISIRLKYDESNNSVIREVKRLSKPGVRVYKSYRNINPYLNGQGIYVVSSSKGVVSDKKCRDLKIGGEVICCVS